MISTNYQTQEFAVRSDGMEVGNESLPTLAAVCRAVGPDLVTLLDAPEGDHQQVSGSILYDPMATPTAFPGAIAVAVGLSLSGKQLPARLQALKSAGYVALVFKSNGADDAGLRKAARRIGIALVRAVDSVAWNQLMEVLDAAVTPSRMSRGTLTDISPGNLFDLANAIAGLTGGAVAVVDPGQTILAYSTLPDQPIDETRRDAILNLHVPHSEQNDADYARVHRSLDIVEVPTDEPSFVRSAIAIRAGETVLGSLWLLEEGDTRSKDARRIIREAAGVAALHILHRRTAYVSTLTAQIDLVRPLLMGMGQAELAAVRLGISAEQVRVAAVNVWPPPAAAPDTLQSRLRLFEILRTACSVRIPGAVCGLADNTAYILLPQTTESSFGFQRQAILGIIRSSARLLSGSILVGIGRPATIRELSQSRTDADHVLAELLRNVEEGRVEPDTEEAIADHESLGPRLHLRQIVRELHGGAELPGVFVSKLVSHDAEKGTRFEETLRVYLECGGNAIVTAKRMAVHVNTIRYRLSRVAPLFALDLDDPDTRLLLWLQLWARHNG